MCGMKTQRRVEGVAAVAAQSLSAHALLRGTAEERLTNGVRSARVVGMKTRPNAGDGVAGVIQPAPSAVRLRGTVGERLASGVRWAEVSGMNKQERKSRGGLADLIWWRSRFGRAGVCDRGLVS